DRPGTKHLTEFYLWMSVGGMVGGVFNALIAPVVFQYGLWEFPLAIFAAGLVRPWMFDVGFLDNYLASIFEGPGESTPPAQPKKGHHKPVSVARSVTASPSLVSTLDYAWPVVVLLLTAILAFALSSPIMSIGNSFFPGSARSRSEGATVLAYIVI